MPNNIIITCGVSQFDIGKLSDLNLKSEVGRSGINDDASEEEEYWKSTEVQKIAEKFSSALFRYSKEPEKFLGEKNNPFGAEASTLIAMKVDKRNQWDPGTDHFVILASHTRKGLVCAAILKQVLIDCFKVKMENINIKMVRDLKNTPTDDTKALANLADIITKKLIEDKTDSHWKNIFVMTGGYKSTIPCLSLFSILYGTKLVYLFDEQNSKKVQELHPWIDFSDKDTITYWTKVFNEFVKTHQDENANDYFLVTLRFRLENKEKSFFYPE